MNTIIIFFSIFISIVFGYFIGYKDGSTTAKNENKRYITVVDSMITVVGYHNDSIQKMLDSSYILTPKDYRKLVKSKIR